MLFRTLNIRISNLFRISNFAPIASLNRNVGFFVNVPTGK